MTQPSEEAILLAIENRTTLFEILETAISSEKRLRVFHAVSDWKVQSELVDETGVSAGTVASACQELEELGLITSRDEGGYEKTIKALDHPLILHLFEEEYLNE